MEEKYRIKLSVLLDSLEYCSDVESDGYYVVQGSNEVIMYGEGLSEEYVGEDELSAYLQSKECLQLPTLHDIDASAPNWNQEITIRYMDEMIEDDKQKKLLRKAYNSNFGNRVLPSIPGSSKFCKELGKLGRMNEWDQFVRASYRKHQLKFLTSWAQARNVEIEDDL